MTKKEYLQARRLVRDNGRFSIQWMAPHISRVMDHLYWGQSKDKLAERADIAAYCKREGIPCNARHTA